MPGPGPSLAERFGADWQQRAASGQGVLSLDGRSQLAANLTQNSPDYSGSEWVPGLPQTVRSYSVWDVGDAGRHNQLYSPSGAYAGDYAGNVAFGWQDVVSGALTVLGGMGLGALAEAGMAAGAAGTVGGASLDGAAIGTVPDGATFTYSAAADSQAANVAIDAAGGDALGAYTSTGAWDAAAVGSAPGAAAAGGGFSLSTVGSAASVLGKLLGGATSSTPRPVVAGYVPGSYTPGATPGGFPTYLALPGAGGAQLPGAGGIDSRLVIGGALLLAAVILLGH